MITINLPLPPSLNALYRNVSGKGRVKTKRYLTWCVVAGTDLMRWRAEQNKNKQPTKMTGPVGIEICLERKNKRADIDNCAKALLDLLTEHQVIDDDREVVDLRLYWARSYSTGATVYVRGVA